METEGSRWRAGSSSGGGASRLARHPSHPSKHYYAGSLEEKGRGQAGRDVRGAPAGHTHQIGSVRG